MNAPNPLGIIDDELVEQIIRRASSSTFDEWWSRVLASGHCAHPVRVTRLTPDGVATVFLRCKDRRASVCPSCSALYASDTWHLVHAGLAGGDGIPDTVGDHPVVFATLTAPSFGPVRSTRTDANRHPQQCHPKASVPSKHRELHVCLLVHNAGDELVGQPLCLPCYDYVGHALFTWHAPAPWNRFGIELRRLVRRAAGVGVRVSFVKVMEMQARAIPHYHAIIRLDAVTQDGTPRPPAGELTADDLGVLVIRAVARANLPVLDIDGAARELVFGNQIDVQPLTRDGDAETIAAARHVAGYLAKYVTKSATDLGIAARRIPAPGIELLEVTDHVRELLRTFVSLAEAVPDYTSMTDWLHTLGYRGHTTSKSRRYSTTMGALREKRTRHARTAIDAELNDDAVWEFTGTGHKNLGDRYLAVSSAIKHHEEVWAARQFGDVSSPFVDLRDVETGGA